MKCPFCFKEAHNLQYTIANSNSFRCSDTTHIFFKSGTSKGFFIRLYDGSMEIGLDAQGYYLSHDSTVKEIEPISPEEAGLYLHRLIKLQAFL